MVINGLTKFLIKKIYRKKFENINYIVIYANNLTLKFNQTPYLNTFKY
jgi:hypothetical protein